MNIPQENGEVFIEPPFSAWPSIIEQNARNLNSYKFSVDGVPFSSVRAQARSEFLRLGLQEQKLWLFTGHQPVFMHPGIWMRYFLLEKGREHGWEGVAFILDSEPADRLTVAVPSWNQGLSRKEIRLPLGGELLLERALAPGEEAWRSFKENVEEALNFPEADEAKKNFLRIHLFQSSVSLFPLFSSQLRRFWEGSPSYREFLLSQMIKTEAFNHFFAHITQKARNFAAIHNGVLAEWRSVNKPRSAAIPFPDLKMTSTEVELPFWWVGEGRRDSLFLYKGEILRTQGKELGSSESLLSSIDFRPRAATLTIFIRLFLADLFVHGVGGAKYEEVTDQIIRHFFQVEPPQFSAATLTLFFPGFADDRSRELRQLLRRMESEPEAYLPPVLIESEGSLIERKKQLLKAGKLSKAEYRELSSINLALRDGLSEELLRLQGESVQEEEKERVLAYRQFPFFFFNPAKVREIVRRL